LPLSPKTANGGKPKAVVSWSSGKDAALSLWRVRQQNEFEVVGLLTTITGKFGRVSMHGVREELLDRQAKAVGLPLRKVIIPFPCPEPEYERAMSEAVSAMEAEGVTRMIFGDIFLQDVRDYRESRLAPTCIKPIFPLWGDDPKELARSMVSSGIEAYVVCLDPKKLSKDFAGRRFDSAFLRDLPSKVDPCGENGEFHTFVSAGPMFSENIPVKVGSSVERDGFVFTDLTIK
jgi:uncharacterized protein (TIGR00290 family)